MGLIQSVDRITRQLEDNNKLSSLKEKRRLENEKLLDEITQECDAFIYEAYEMDTIADAIVALDKSVAEISSKIINLREVKRVDVIEGDDWKTEKKEVRKYNITNEYELERTIEEIFLKEVKRVGNIFKIKEQSLQGSYTKKLKNIFDDKLKYMPNLAKGVLWLANEETESNIIEELSKNDNDAELLKKYYNDALTQYEKEHSKQIAHDKKNIRKEEPVKIKINIGGGRTRRRRKTKIKTGGLLLWGLTSFLNTYSGTKRRR